MATRPGTGLPSGTTVGTQFLAFNRNKRSLTLNLKDQRSVQIFKDLAKDADVMLESLRTGTADRMGLGYDVISEAEPPHCVLLAFRATGERGL